jgi:hypothetical protein
MFNVD